MKRGKWRAAELEELGVRTTLRHGDRQGHTPTSRPASPPVSVPRTSKSSSHGGNDSNICKGDVSLASRPAFCITRAGKRSPSPPGTSPLQIHSRQVSVRARGRRQSRGGRRDGEPRFLLLPRACPKASSRVLQLSSTVVIDINEGRRLASEGPANFRL